MIVRNLFTEGNGILHMGADIARYLFELERFLYIHVIFALSNVHLLTEWHCDAASISPLHPVCFAHPPQQPFSLHHHLLLQGHP